jgi:RNA polymerase sigma-70 factor (ECF subfamily)
MHSAAHGGKNHDVKPTRPGAPRPNTLDHESSTPLGNAARAAWFLPASPSTTRQRRAALNADSSPLVVNAICDIVAAAMPPDAGDLELIARLNRGDTAAFAPLYERYRGWVLRLAIRRLGDSDEALDIMQETFLRLFARFPGFELTSAMATFLYPIVDKLCQRRRVQSHRTVSFDENAPPAPELATPVHSRSGELASLLAHLTTEQNELLSLRFADDMSLPHLAERFDVPVGTVKSRLHYALGALRQKAAVRRQQP